MFINDAVADGDTFASYCLLPDFSRILGSYPYSDFCDLWAITDAAGHRAMYGVEGYSQQDTVEVLLEWADKAFTPVQVEA